MDNDSEDLLMLLAHLSADVEQVGTVLLARNYPMALVLANNIESRAKGAGFPSVAVGAREVASSLDPRRAGAPAGVGVALLGLSRTIAELMVEVAGQS
jgi:hypothetical protein